MSCTAWGKRASVDDHRAVRLQDESSGQIMKIVAAIGEVVEALRKLLEPISRGNFVWEPRDGKVSLRQRLRSLCRSRKLPEEIRKRWAHANFSEGARAHQHFLKTPERSANEIERENPSMHQRLPRASCSGDRLGNFLNGKSTQRLQSNVEALPPQTEFPMRASLPQREPAQVEKWLKDRVYYRMADKNGAAKKPKFLLHDGPPYANGNIPHRSCAQ